jgi:hypothetical protein
LLTIPSNGVPEHHVAGLGEVVVEVQSCPCLGNEPRQRRTTPLN